ncbi:hypothetical protein G4B88_020639 [Cannabis sativa]|uniref:Ribulose bisphosphate carboxylase small subunit, chloroplastic n=1 Tax=Cannabis sativa TaxID=3483 RepID=A0A7J6HL92_CANSA|nr:hypothetical protein G4B88_020639 [Cannabis sativa]
MNKTLLTSISITHSPSCLLLRLLQTCSTMEHLNQIHAHTITQGLSRFTYIASKLLAFSASLSSSNSGHLGYAQKLFDQITTPNVFDFNSMLMGFSKISNFEKGLSLYTKMRRIGVDPNSRTFTVLVKACFVVSLLGQLHGQIVRFGHCSDAYVTSSVISTYSKFGSMELARRVFDQSVDKNVVCWTSLLSGYCNNGLISEARQVFDEMPMRNDVSYSAMVSGYVRNNCFYEAIELFRELKTCSNVNLKGSLLVSGLNACGSVGAFQEGKWVHLFIDKIGIEYELELSTALIDFYAKCGFIRDAQEVFDKMGYKDVTAWTAMIVGLAVNGENYLGLELFREMEEKGPKPNAVTFIGVLTACNHETLVDKAWVFLGRMFKVYRISPEIEHYGCMVDLLARSGRVKEAEMLIKHMPMKPDGAIWGSMLKGCLVHGYVELGEMVGKVLIELEPKHSGRYVVLANMYATIGSWEEVIRVRKMMKERDVVTISGWSFIEISGVVHKFVADDKSHSQSRNIYCVLDQLKRELKSSSIAQFSTMKGKEILQHCNYFLSPFEVRMSATSFTAPAAVSGYVGLRSNFTELLPAKDSVGWTRKTVSNGSKTHCMKTWNPINNKKFEALSYLPPLSDDSIAKEINYMIRKGWIPCLEFDEVGHVYRENSKMPGYYDGRYWTMWKLPMFGCNDSSQVLSEIHDCKKAFPTAYIRCLAFDNIHQGQCMSFVIQKPT